jgi:hypothetical protein
MRRKVTQSKEPVVGQASHIVKGKPIVKEASEAAKIAIVDMIRFCEGLRETSSKRTHYDRLNEWSDEVYGYIREKLAKFGHVSGSLVNVASPNLSLWFEIYGLMSSVSYSPYLETQVARHHSSAYERNEALIMELKELNSLIN